jgi:hypothetical protein
MPCAVLDAVSAIIAHYAENESYDILVLKHFNYPLVLEVPLFQMVYDKRCSWVSIINILLPGLVIGYNLRFDKSKNTAINTVPYNHKKIKLLSFFGLVGGCTLWIVA